MSGIQPHGYMTIENVQGTFPIHVSVPTVCVLHIVVLAPVTRAEQAIIFLLSAHICVPPLLAKY